MKLCKDCKNYRPDNFLGISAWGLRGLDKCSRDPHVNLIDGSVTYIKYCDRERYHTGASFCGPEAKFFEPKKVK
jgi:hypothetical protein